MMLPERKRISSLFPLQPARPPQAEIKWKRRGNLAETPFPLYFDASVVAANCSWILGEMIRHAQHAAIDANAAKTIVESLTRKKYPLIEEVDGRVYFHYKKKSAPDVALLALAYRYPRRMREADLIATVRRHGLRKTTPKSQRVG